RPASLLVRVASAPPPAADSSTRTGVSGWSATWRAAISPPLLWPTTTGAGNPWSRSQSAAAWLSSICSCVVCRAPPTGSRPLPAGPARFDSTAATAGPWSADSQHGGPPSALLAREFERTASDPGQRLARIAVEILRPVPVRPLTVRARVARPGRRVTLVEGAIEVDGQEFVLARGWRIARTPTAAAATPGAA